MPPWKLKLINALVSQGFLSSPEADDAAVEASVDALVNTLTLLQTERLANDLATFKAVIPAGQEAFIKQALTNDRAGALAYLQALQGAASQGAAAPQVRLTDGSHVANGLLTQSQNALGNEGQRSAQRLALVNTILRRDYLGESKHYDAAWAAAASEKPELFTETTEA